MLAAREEPAFINPVPPFPGWERRIYRLSRPVTGEDIRALRGDEDPITRETGGTIRSVILKFGLAEINLIEGVSAAEVWYDPGRGGFPAEYVGALFATRF